MRQKELGLIQNPGDRAREIGNAIDPGTLDQLKCLEEQGNYVTDHAHDLEELGVRLI